LGGVALPAPGLRAFAFLALSLALGPGLLVNLLLKDHWHRPRPVQVEAFGGTMPFRPYYRADGACRRNCSFVSGEGSTAVWCLAPALLAPPPLQTAAVLAAVAFSAGTCVLRMAFGGHFLSDVVFAALLTWLIIIAAWRSTQAGAGRR
jgi:membrane-associated phospholipid phosphatase